MPMIAMTVSSSTSVKAARVTERSGVLGERMAG